MTYVALLRGINVGGNRKVEMAKLKLTFERLGFSHVKTLIASGNVIFVSGSDDKMGLTKKIEDAIEKDFGFPVAVVLRSLAEISDLVDAIPKDWVNDKEMKCDVMFLWNGIDNPELLDEFPTDPTIEDIMYVPGAIVWRVDRQNIGKSKVIKNTVGTELYRQLTVRNPNTVRKIHALMLAAEQA
jgi:uncharacterized protein (DUF1697 family)